MSKSAKTCKYPFCQDIEDLERGASMCTEHSLRWMRSEAFLDAARNEDVRLAMRLSQDLGMREIAKHRRRWAKAEAAREGGA